MSLGKKTLLVAAGIAMMLGVGVFSAFVILVHDEPPPPDDSDLVLVRPEVPADRNAWTHYARAVENLDLPQRDEDSKWPPAPVMPAPATGEKPPEKAPETDPPPDVADRWDGVVYDRAWEQPLADEVLARNAACLAHWEKGLALPECLVPEVKDPMDRPSAYSFLKVAELVTGRAHNYARQGHHEAAMEDALRLVRFGHHAESGRDGLVSYLVGITVKGMGINLVREFTVKGRLTPDRLRRTTADLAAYEEDRRVLAEALMAEYGNTLSISRKIVSGEMNIEMLGFGRRGPPVRHYLERVLFKPNRTRRIMAECYREMIAAAPKRFADAPDFDKFRTMAVEEQRWAGGNYGGGTFFGLTVMGCRGVQELKCRANINVAATRVLLAMRAFKIEKGRLPTTLDELVPAYLDTVPLDDFDGKPLRYNPAKKVIYSVGKDLRDDGGMTKQEFLDAKMREGGIDPKTADPEELKSLKEECEDPWGMPDPSFPIEF